jgi:hypothetical protein
MGASRAGLPASRTRLAHIEGCAALIEGRVAGMKDGVARVEGWLVRVEERDARL